MDFDNDYGDFDPATKDCDSSKCWKTQQFHWLQEDNCTASFVCSTMEYNVCGDFGVVIGQEGYEDRDYCFPREHFSRVLQQNDRLDINIWFIQGVNFRLKCYLWCTESGDFPREPKPKVDGAFLEKLVRYLGVKLKILKIYIL